MFVSPHSRGFRVIPRVLTKRKKGIGRWTKNFKYRKILTFDNSGQTEDLTNIPILVKLTTTNFDYSHCKSDGSDLRFYSSDDVTLLKHHIEKWDITGNSFLWVKVPSITGSSSTDFVYFYYGNATADSVVDEENTYDSNYVLVQHLQEASGTLYDSTSNNNDGTQSGGVTYGATGQINSALSFDGVDDYVDCGNDASLNPIVFTLEAWAYSRANAAGGAFKMIVERQTSYAFGIYWDGANSEFYTSINDGTWADYSSDYVMPLNIWKHLATTRDSAGNLKFYVDGVFQKAFAGTKTPATNSLKVDIGDDPAAHGHKFNGIIDEVRISNIVRSADWIAAIYLSETDAFITFGTEVKRFG